MSFQVPPANAVPGNMQGSHIVSNRNVPRQQMPIGMQRVQAQGMPPYNISSQAGMGGGLNPGMPMQRGVPLQAHQQQQVHSHILFLRHMGFAGIYVSFIVCTVLHIPRLCGLCFPWDS